MPFTSEGSWYGQIGIEKGFRIDKLAWHLDQTVTGEWDLENTKPVHRKVTGKINCDSCAWTGFIEIGGERKFIMFEELKINPETLKVMGSGKHQYALRDLKYMVYG